MKNILLICLVSGIVGAGIGWTINHNRWGYREARFGPFDFEGTVTLANIEEHVNFGKNEITLASAVELLDESTYDFGVMRPNSKGEHVFRVRNSGEAALNLRIGASTCKCTIGELENEALEPGEETEIKLSWNVKPGAKKFEQSAQLLTNAPGQPAITLKIVGAIVADFELLPTVWTFGEASVEDDFEVSGVIYNYTSLKVTPDVDQFGFTSDELSELAEFEVEEIPLEEVREVRKLANQGFRVKSKVKKGMPQGNISQQLIFKYQLSVPDSVDDLADNSDDDRTPAEQLEALRDSPEDDFVRSIGVPIRGRIVGPLRMIPNAKLKQLYSGKYRYKFGKLGRAESTVGKAFVVVRGKNREDVNLSVKEVSPEGVISAQLGEPKNRGSMVLRQLTLTVRRPDETIERMGKIKDDYGKVVIVADDDAQSTMEIQVQFAIKGR